MEREKPPILSRLELGTLVASALAVAFGVAYASPEPHLFGNLFGLAPAQTVRVSLTDHKISELKVAASNPCLVQVKIFDADGSVVVQSEHLKILPGVSFSHDLKYSELKRPGTDLVLAADLTNRAQLRVTSYLVDETVKGEKWIESCRTDLKLLKLSVEVFDDATGRTSFMVPTDSFPPGQ